ncbi:SpaA isopeptide-forming pilin-related protein [Mediterraneibacter gnavus]|uniref:SpaA isopeptide-forming pilin-related protein n=1 Tax=Mediterraneibacter gnavus TaxID=33038 RepID=UPI001184873D|nr:SpaA isopeptide-forming pilin-related protein [Mediterraneibacter gnavus]
MKKWKRILSAALSVLLLSGSISVCAAERTYTDRSEVIGTAVVVGDEDSAGGSSLFSRPGTIATITPGKNHSYGSWGTCEFNVKTETGNHLGFCAEPNSGTPSGNFSVSILDDSIEKNANIKAAVLCYVIPELYEALGKNIYNEKDNNTYAYCHALVGYLYSGSLTGLSASMANGVKMMRDTVNAHRQTNPTLISYMQRYQVYVAYNDQQDIVWVEEQQKGSMNLKKESANPEVTDGNSCYSREGAIYGVYKEQACTTKIADLTTDAQGNSNTVEVDAGTYYVKETKAPKGFVLDEQVHPVTVTAGKTAVLKVKDLPQLDPVGVLLGKIDKETNQNKPQGSASLEGAEFTVKYYKTEPTGTQDPAEQGKTPERTWIFRTDADGFISYAPEYLISGDELYLSPTKNPSIPLGVVTLQETKAPEGYLINPEVYVVPITSSNDGSEFVETYNQPKIPETLLTLDIVKVLKGKDTPISGVVFTHTDSKGNQEEVTTDEKGQAVLKGLTRGTHTIQEKSVPDGYTKNPGVLKFSVDENNKITLLENTATDKTGTMKFTVREDGTAQLHVEDVLAPYQLIVHKVNDHAKVLEGAEFTLYTDEECKQELQKATSGKDGILRFQDLEVETKYYLKETKAPDGYRIPVNSDGTDIVYEIYTKSDPQKDLFEYYVNGEKHTEETGDFAITGTKAEREVHLKVINPVGMKMPETGSPWTLGIILVGIGCLIVAGYFMKRKGKQEDEEK